MKAITAAFAIAAAVAVTAGCGGGSTSQALALDPVAAAATKTQHAAARIRLQLALSAPQLQGQTFRLHGAGAIDGESGELTLRPTGAAVPPQLRHGSLKEISLEQAGDYVVYLRVGFLASYLPGGVHWVKLNVSKLGSSAGLDVQKLLSGSQFQPTDLLSLLKADGAKIRKVGSARFDGTATTHYRVTVDMAKALQAKGLTSPLLAGMAARLPKVPEDVWIGKDGLVRRVRISYGMTEHGRRVHAGMTMSLFDYGAHITIAAPPESDVFDATQLAQSGIANTLLH
jgi:hypothetical protein